MKTNWIARLGVLALVLTLITTSLVSGTFAKYTTAASGTDTVRVAKFDVAVTDGATPFTTATPIDIFKTVGDTGVFSDDIIAPGTTGDFDIVISNKSEVKVSATLAFAETNPNDVPIYYVYNTQRYSSVLTGTYTGDNNGSYKTLDALATDMTGSPIVMDATNGTTPVTETLALDWFWAFESAGTGQSDPEDTALGTATERPEVTLDITVTATQLDV